MATNDFLPFCSVDTGTNLESQADYAADPQLLIGNQPGIARSALVNKAIRQATYIASCLAQFLANTTGDNLLDDATASEVLATMGKTFAPRSMVIVNTFNGYGSTGTRVAVYTNLETNIGTDITYTPDAVNGDKFTINTTGVYCVSICGQVTSANSNAGVSKNAGSTSTDLISLPLNEILMAQALPAGEETEFSTTQIFAANDVLRFQGDGQTLNPSSFTRFRITKVSS